MLGALEKAPPQTPSSVPTWGGLWVLPCALGQPQRPAGGALALATGGAGGLKKRRPTGHSGFCQFLSVCCSGWWEEAVSGYFLLWLFDLREGERRSGERWE